MTEFELIEWERGRTDGVRSGQEDRRSKIFWRQQLIVKLPPTPYNQGYLSGYKDGIAMPRGI